MLVALAMSLVVLQQAQADKGPVGTVEPQTFGFGFNENIYGSYKGHDPIDIKPFPKSKLEDSHPQKGEKLPPPTYLSKH